MSEDLEQTNSETGQEEEVDSQNNQEEQTDSTNSQEETGDSKNANLYARMKKAEEENKKNRAKLASYESQAQKVEDKFPEQDPYELAKTVHALRDYSTEEIDIIKRQAKALDVSPAEATQSEDVQAIINHRRQKVEQEQSNPVPTNRQQPQGEDFSNWTPQTVEDKFQAGDEESRKQIDKYYQWLRTSKQVL